MNNYYDEIMINVIKKKIIVEIQSGVRIRNRSPRESALVHYSLIKEIRRICSVYTSDATHERSSLYLGCSRNNQTKTQPIETKEHRQSNINEPE